MAGTQTTWSRQILVRSFWFLAGVWTLLIGLSVAWHMSNVTNLINSIAAEQARATLQRDLRYRRWNADHGGVYVPITDRCQPNPHLTVPDRDVTTTTGVHLTLINPAFMNRQVYELEDKGDGIRAHLTSLHPLRPQNTPDEWEAGVLRSFERGAGEAMELTAIDGQPHLRLMRPFITETRCLKCHGTQGYRVGDVRGGLSIAVPIVPLKGISDTENRNHLIIHALLWIFGMVGLVGLHRRMQVLDRRHRQAERERHVQRDFTQDLIDAIPMPVFFKDTEGHYQVVNEAFLTFLGLPRERIIGCTAYDIAPKTQADIYRAKDAELLASGGVQVYQTEARDALGRMRPVSLHRSVCFRDGRIIGMVGVTVDLTERMAADDALYISEQRFRQLFEHNIAGVALHEIICNEAGVPMDYRFIDCNHAFETLTGLKRDLLIGRTVLEVLPQTELEWITRYGKVALSGIPDHFENYSAGLGRWFEVGAFQTSPGRFAVMFQDVSARKEIEEALRRAHAEAKDAIQVKNRFLATMNHEIRTPLNGIIGLTSLLRRSSLPREQMELVDMVHGSGQQLLALINDILDLIKIDAGRIELEHAPISLVQLIGDLRGSFSAAFAAKGLAFEVATDPALGTDIVGDPLRLRQILTNLIGNAIKFTEHGGVTMTVRAGAASIGDQTLVLEIRDTGIGIPADYLPHLFEPFTQADISSTRRHGGTGLGLTVVKRLVDLMGGTIAVDSGTSGTCITITLPQPDSRSVPGTRDVVEPATAIHAGPVPHVLVVEDNPTNLTMTHLMLKELGIRCQLATDGDRALDCIRRERFDLVLMDCGLPNRDGYATTRAIREQEAAQGGQTHLVVIAITGSIQSQDIQRCKESGMDAVLAKPFTFEALRNCLTPWLQRQPPPT